MDRPVTKSELDQLESVLDKVFARIGIDVEFTRHFLDRVNDERNRKQITIKELALLFKKEFQKWGKPIAQLGPDAEAVMKDLESDINVPFALRWDAQNQELDMIAKTVMRKKNFRTSNKEFTVEDVRAKFAIYMKENEERTPEQVHINKALNALHRLETARDGAETLGTHAFAIYMSYGLERVDMSLRQFSDMYTQHIEAGTEFPLKEAVAELDDKDIALPDASVGFGIARKDMPQIHKDDYADYFDYLASHGAHFTKEIAHARDLKPTQSEFSKQGVEKAIKKNKLKKPVIASKDNYILDGHHRWLAAAHLDQDMTVYRVDMDIATLLDLTNKFPKVTYKDIYEAWYGTKKVPTATVKKSKEKIDDLSTKIQALQKKHPGMPTAKARMIAKGLISEGYKLQLERDADMYVLHITDSTTGKRTEVRGKSGYESGNYDANDKLHQLLDKIGKASNISDLMNGEVVGINPRHPDGASAKSHADVAFNESYNGGEWTGPIGKWIKDGPDGEVAVKLNNGRMYRITKFYDENMRTGSIRWKGEYSIFMWDEHKEDWEWGDTRYEYKRELMKEILLYDKPVSESTDIHPDVIAAYKKTLAADHNDAEYGTTSTKRQATRARNMLSKKIKQYYPDLDSQGKISLRTKLQHLDEVAIDNKDGMGAVPNNQEIDYRGLRVQMKPSTFLSLAAPTSSTASDEMKDYIKQGGAIGAPFLVIYVPEEGHPYVTGHEGRHRMMSVLEVEGDNPVEVHLFFQGQVRKNSQLTPELIAQMKQSLESETPGKVVTGPLWESGVGIITKQNTTPDVKPGETQRQAEKFGNKLDKDGNPPVLEADVELSDLDTKTPSILDIVNKHEASVDEILAQVRKGIDHELEHTTDRSVALKIALDHLIELPDYYDRLDTIEGENHNDND